MDYEEMASRLHGCYVLCTHFFWGRIGKNKDPRRCSRNRVLCIKVLDEELSIVPFVQNHTQE